MILLVFRKTKLNQQWAWLHIQPYKPFYCLIIIRQQRRQKPNPQVWKKKKKCCPRIKLKIFLKEQQSWNTINGLPRFIHSDLPLCKPKFQSSCYVSTQRQVKKRNPQFLHSLAWNTNRSSTRLDLLPARTSRSCGKCMNKVLKALRFLLLNFTQS